MHKFLNMLSFTIGCCLFGIGLILYWYLPINVVGWDSRVDGLINRLASANAPIEGISDWSFDLRNFLDNNPGSWDPDAQKPVSDAYYELKSMGKEAFPYLIKHFDDDRYSHVKSSSVYYSVTVGDACQDLIDQQVGMGGVGYKWRDAPKGSDLEIFDFENYVKSNYGSYAAWWRNNRTRTLPEMSIAYCNWRISQEERVGFVDDDQATSMRSSFKRLLSDAEKPPDEMPLPPPDWYTIDELVIEIQLREQFKSFM